MKGKRGGRIQLTWRYEVPSYVVRMLVATTHLKQAEDEQSMIDRQQMDEVEGGSNLGTIALHVESAHGIDHSRLASISIVHAQI